MWTTVKLDGQFWIWNMRMDRETISETCRYFMLFMQIKCGSKLSPCLINHYAMKAYGTVQIVSCIANLGGRCRWVVRFMPLPLYPWGKSPRDPLARRLDVPQSLSGHCGEDKNLLPLQKIETWFLGYQHRVLAAVPIELSRLLLCSNNA
jgi:hypothetical protein